MDYKEYFYYELNNKYTNYFIFDSYGTKPDGIGDVEFTGYVYELDHNGKPRAGDLFLYRRPTSKFEKRFYFYGACKIEKIENIDGNKVRAVISKPYQFVDVIYQDDVELEKIKWVYKNRIENMDGSLSWKYMFNQYGMTNITKEDFMSVMNIQNTPLSSGRTIKEIELETKFYQQIIFGNYRVDNPSKDEEIKTAYNNAFSRRIKENYNYKCAITGMKTDLYVKRFKKGPDNLLNPRNGICFHIFFADAFGKGYIAFSDKYKLIVSKELKKIDVDKYYKLIKYEGWPIVINDKSLLPDLSFIKEHRTKYFKN